MHDPKRRLIEVLKEFDVNVARNLNAELRESIKEKGDCFHFSFDVINLWMTLVQRLLEVSSDISAKNIALSQADVDRIYSAFKNMQHNVRRGSDSHMHLFDERFAKLEGKLSNAMIFHVFITFFAIVLTYFVNT